VRYLWAVSERQGPTSGPKLKAFAATAPGLADLTALELRSLGIRPWEVEQSGVTFSGPAEVIHRANLWLRTASRVSIRIGEFSATAFHELERRSRTVPWDRFLQPGAPFRLRVTCHKSRLYHSDAVAQRVAAAIEQRTGGTSAGTDGEDDGGAQLFLVRFDHDRCTISADSSGALLHRRGYRLETAKAPLRETLAAAMVMTSGWSATRPLLDPMCGAGTIPIEGAMIGRRMAPGRRRDFAFMQWPEFDAGQWRGELERAHEKELGAAAVRIAGSDRDNGAIGAAIANAERAGVLDSIELSRRALSAIEPGEVIGDVITNPPSGIRVGEEKGLRDLYAQLGNVLRRKCPGWRVSLLSASPRLSGQLGLQLSKVLETVNGGIPVRLVRGTVASDSV
jgi:putative N6-adenine-specific DNA methylase